MKGDIARAKVTFAEIEDDGQWVVSMWAITGEPFYCTVLKQENGDEWSVVGAGFVNSNAFMRGFRLLFLKPQRSSSVLRVGDILEGVEDPSSLFG